VLIVRDRIVRGLGGAMDGWIDSCGPSVACVALVNGSRDGQL
jgi:hypothetical protein